MLASGGLAATAVVGVPAVRAQDARRVKGMPRRASSGPRGFGGARYAARASQGWVAPRAWRTCSTSSGWSRGLGALAPLRAVKGQEGVPAFAEEGPLWEKVPNVDLSGWDDAASFLANDLGVSADPASDPAGARRIHHYYLPVFFWTLKRIQMNNAMLDQGTAPAWSGRDQNNEVRKSDGRRPMFLGISAPQGCGKTTLVGALERLLESKGLKCVVASMDDFYLTGAEQDAVAAANPGNALLQFRGNAGTHDVNLAVSTFDKLRTLEAGETCAVPRYDKSLRGGKGDRAPESEWVVAKGPVDVVLFEGWSFGFRPLDLEEGETAPPDVAKLDDNLRFQGYSEWANAMDSWLTIRVDNVDCVYKWRLQAEHQRIAEGGAGLSDEAIRDFVDRFMPAYKAYLPSLYNEGPWMCRDKYTAAMTVAVDESRSPVPLPP